MALGGCRYEKNFFGVSISKCYALNRSKPLLSQAVIYYKGIMYLFLFGRQVTFLAKIGGTIFTPS
jgi:hypothetical protein